MNSMYTKNQNHVSLDYNHSYQVIYINKFDYIVFVPN